MATTAHENIITTAQIQVKAREIDFVTQFARNWQALMDVMSITKPIKMMPGTALTSKYVEGELVKEEVGEGEFIPRSQYTVKEKPYENITIDKYAKETTLEAINKYGYEVAVGMTDEEFMIDIQDDLKDRFYTRLQTGTLKFREKTLQMAIAMAIGKVKSEFKKMHRNVTAIAAWVNTLDLYAYLGSAEITVQTQFGFNYVENFLGVEKLFISDEIARGTVIATPMNNINAYFIDPADGDFAKAGLVYTTDGVTNLVGFAAKGDYDHATSVAYAVDGLRLFAEFENAIAIVTVDPSAEDKDTASATPGESATPGDDDEAGEP